jgi:hypothetical protein
VTPGGAGAPAPDLDLVQPAAPGRDPLACPNRRAP